MKENMTTVTSKPLNWPYIEINFTNINFIRFEITITGKMTNNNCVLYSIVCNLSKSYRKTIIQLELPYLMLYGDN